jgi:hypothetical protein
VTHQSGGFALFVLSRKIQDVRRKAGRKSLKPYVKMFKPLRMRRSKHHFFDVHDYYYTLPRGFSMAENIKIYGKAG